MRQSISFLYICLFFSTQIFAQWQKVDSVPGEIIYSLSAGGATFVAGTSNSVYLSNDNGSLWAPSSIISNDAGSVEAAIVFNNDLYVGTVPVGVFKSTDNGSTWNELNNGLAGLGARSISSFVQRDGRLYVSTFGSGVFELDSLTGTQWNPYQNNFPVGISGTVTDMILSSGTLITSGGGNGYIYRNESGSDQWEESFVFNALPDAFIISDLYSDGNYIFAGSNYRIHSSSDNGITWNYLFDGLPKGIDIQLTGFGENIFAVINGVSGCQLYVSNNNGNNWDYVNNLDNPYVYGIEIIGDRIYAATEIGLYYIDLSTVGVDDNISNPNYFALYQNYPNPFNPTTKIKYEIPGPPISASLAKGRTEEGFVSLKVYDILGNEIATLVNEQQLPGFYEVNFDASKLASGIYLYKLQLGSFIETKKMVLLR